MHTLLTLTKVLEIHMCDNGASPSIKNFMATLHADHRGIRLVSLPAGENEGFEGRRHRHRRRVATGGSLDQNVPRSRHYCN